MKQFIAISTATLNNKLVLINTSKGEALANPNGIDFDVAIDFLFSIFTKYRHNKIKPVFVSYGFAKDNEFIFSTASKELKDKLFQSVNIKRDLLKLEVEQEKTDTAIYKYLLKDSIDGWFLRPNLTADELAEYKSLDFDKYVTYLSKKELLEVKTGGYEIALANGKFLTIKKNKRSFTIYDIFGFFKPDNLLISCQKWLGIGKIENECESISALMAKLNDELEKQGIKLNRYHGSTTVTSWLLSKSNAKKYYHAYRYGRQIADELNKATYQSYYGGRGEQHKLGTVYNVNIYDINSAYAYASTFLPVLLSKPYFVKDYQEQPFSIWYCEYNFADINPYFGYLPNRNLGNPTQYKLKGRGYFWFPEIQFILQNFPECVNIKQGYVWDYELAPFTDEINDFYNLRLKLQAENNPLEKVIKKALQSIYGKFCQHQGKGHFYNMFYAGFICSFVRRMLLDATSGFGQETICFLTDAIHTTAKLNIPVSNNLGEYKLESYDKVIYLDNGVYQCWNDGKVIKTKHKGSKQFDFAASVNNLNEKQYYTADNNIFVGHNIFSMNQFQNAKYLQNIRLDKNINPLENVPRIFETKKVDFSSEFIDSKIVSLYGGKESAIYRHNEMNIGDFNLELMEVR